MTENRTTSGVNIHQMTGEVVGADKSSTTQVHGGGGGGTGHIVGGHGYTATNPVSITSSTAIHDQIFLRDANGKERAFQLSNFNVACREGHKLSVLWAIKKGKKRGPFFRVLNHTTGESYQNKDGLKRLFMPHWIVIPLLVIISVWYTVNYSPEDFGHRSGYLMVSLFLMPFIAEIGRNVVASIRARSFMKSDVLKKTLMELEAV